MNNHMNKYFKHRNDVYIGKDDWIKWIDIDDQKDKALNIDNYLISLDNLWRKLETECVAACCGIDAFDLTSDTLKKVIVGFDANILLTNLMTLSNDIDKLNSVVLVSQRFNNYFHKTMFKQILDHLIKCVKYSI